MSGRSVVGVFSSPRILKIIPSSFFGDYGCHVRVLEEALALQRMGCSVTLCTYAAGNNPQGLDIRRPVKRAWHRPIQVGSSYFKLLYDLLLLKTSMAAALESRPHLVHAHLHEGALIGSFVSRLLKVPLCFDFQGSLTSEMVDHRFIGQGNPLLPLLKRLETTIEFAADMVLTSSQYAADTIRNRHPGWRGKVYSLPDGVDIHRFRPREELLTTVEVTRLKRQLGVPDGRPVVVYLGLLAEYQGTSLLLQAARHLVETGGSFHLLVMGYPSEEHYRLKAKELGLEGHITFTGRIPYHLAPRFLALGDVAVSPKMSQTEGNGKLLNYMAMGLPTVAFDVPVAREFLDDLGTYARIGSPRDLARAIDGLLQNPEEAQHLGRELRRRAVDLFSWQENGKRLLSLYEQLWRQRFPLAAKGASWTS